MRYEKKDKEVLESIIEKLKQKKLKDWSHWSDDPQGRDYWRRGYSTYIDNFRFDVGLNCGYPPSCPTSFTCRCESVFLEVREENKLIAEFKNSYSCWTKWEDGYKGIRKFYHWLDGRFEEVKRIREEKATIERQKQEVEEERIRQTSLNRLRDVLKE
jgi:hypothetical protein